MPINVPENLPAKDILKNENVFVMDEKRAHHQDIRPLNIVILNLMPQKQKTETHLLRLLGNTALQVFITLLRPGTHVPKTEGMAHLKAFYKTFNQIKERKFDGMIITGAPIEHLEFDEVNYWDELKTIMDWTTTNVTSTLHICWGAQAGLYHHFGIQKYPLKQKLFGIFPHQILKENINLLRGFDEEFYAPHSRFTETRQDDIESVPNLQLLSTSNEAGVYLAATKDGSQIYLTGHPEYDAWTLDDEYQRDLKRGLSIQKPKNYYSDDNETKKPLNKWRSHANLLFANWLNYYVYQETPFDWK